MKKLSFLLALALTTTTTAVLAGGVDDPATLNQISGYRQWTRVNSEPVIVELPFKLKGGEIPLDIAS
jgi:hypothetical protein